MPGKKAMPYASEKRNRQYEHVKESELEEGKSEKVAKRIAGATVNATRRRKGELKKKP